MNLDKGFRVTNKRSSNAYKHLLQALCIDYFISQQPDGT